MLSFASRDGILFGKVFQWTNQIIGFQSPPTSGTGNSLRCNLRRHRQDLVRSQRYLEYILLLSHRARMGEMRSTIPLVIRTDKLSDCDMFMVSSVPGDEGPHPSYGVLLCVLSSPLSANLIAKYYANHETTLARTGPAGRSR